MTRLPLQRNRRALWIRLYRIRLFSALVMILPGLFLVGWYSYSAWVAHHRYNRAVGADRPLTVETFHLHLYDFLRRDGRRLLMPEPPKKGPVPVIGLHLGNKDLDTLARNLPPGEGSDEYVGGFLQRKSRFYKVKVRYRGSRHWHWNYPQKSWKVRLLNGQFFDGRDTIALINTAEPMPFAEQISLDVAREQGLLVPDYYPVRLHLNNVPLGLYFLSTQPDEGLLRNASRMPGDLYSGSDSPVDPNDGMAMLWESANYWKKVAAPQGGKLKQFGTLEALLKELAGADQADFERFARLHLDLNQFARFDAVDVIFGSNQHDFHEDHKLYFDPYKGRFEPVAWHIRGWRHANRFNRTDNPLLLRLKELPEYRVQRNRIVYQMLTNGCSPDAMARRADELFTALAPEQATDPYWDAYDLLPDLNDDYFDEWVRPMDFQRQATVFEDKMDTYRERATYLIDELLTRGLSGKRTGPRTLTLTVSGQTAYRLEAATPQFSPQCSSAAYTLYADTDLDGQLDKANDLRVAPGATLDLVAGSVLEARPRVHPHRGNVRSLPAPQDYRFFVDSPCEPVALHVTATSLVTDGSLTFSVPWTPPEAEGSENAATPVSTAPLCDGSYAPQPGQHARHPWCSPLAAPATVTLGPGLVKVNETLVYEPHQTVIIAAGTELRFKKRAGLLVRGKLLAHGTADAPIVLGPRKKRWQGLALWGPGTSGSRLQHVTVEKGTSLKWGLGSFPAMVNIHDTADIHIESCTFAEARKGEDAFHAAYVKGLLLVDTTIVDSQFDALDLEFCTARLERVTVVDAGDECLDLMGSPVSVAASRFVDCKGSGLSVGEGSDVQLRDSLVAHARTGVLVKNASSLDWQESLVWDSKTGLGVNFFSDRYEGRSKVRAEHIHAVHCDKAVHADGGLKAVESIVTHLGPGTLAGLPDVLPGMAAWPDVEAVVEKLREEVAR